MNPFSLLVSAVSLLFWVTTTGALKGDSGCGTYMCINATVVGDMVTYELTPLFRRDPGWMAVGWGRNMKGSHMVIMWKNEDNTTSLSQRFATGHTEPKPVQDPPRIARLTDTKTTAWHDGNLTTLAFEIPLNKTHHRPGTDDEHFERLIWAYGLRRPNSPDPDHATVMQHFAAGRLQLDLTKDLPESTSVYASTEGGMTKPFASHETLVLLHGIGITLGMVVLLPLSALTARYLRTFTSKWLRIHQIFNFYVGLPLIVAAWLLGPLAVINAQASHFLDAHQICGFIMLLLYLSQVYLGRYIHSRPKTKPHPPSNILHATFGTVLITLAFLQVRSGLNEWQTATGRPRPPQVLYILLDSWALTVLAAYLIGLSLLRRQFLQEKNGTWPKPSDYIALSMDGRSPIAAAAVFEADPDNLGMYGDSESTFKETDVEPLLHKR